jgi:hypothetical protein
MTVVSCEWLDLHFVSPIHSHDSVIRNFGVLLGASQVLQLWKHIQNSECTRWHGMLDKCDILQEILVNDKEH